MTEQERKEKYPHEYCADHRCKVRLGSQYQGLGISHCLAHMNQRERMAIDAYMDARA